MTDNSSTTTNPTPTTGLMATGSQMTNEQFGVTQFLDDAGVKEVMVKNVPNKTNGLPIRDQQLSDFFSRPVIVGSPTWSVSDAVNDQLFTIDPGQYLAAYPPWYEKIRGFNLFRGTCVLRVTINANPFQQGKLILSFIPCASSTSSSWRNYTMLSKTVQPNVEIDCRETTVTLRVPYVTPFEYYSFTNDQPTRDNADWGTYTLSVLSPLATGTGPITVSTTIFMSFEDVEFAAPVAFAQAGVKIKKRSKRPKASIGISEAEATAQATTGSISKALSVGSTITSKLSEIPMLASIATPATWMLRGASGVASWFGWSKPAVDSPGEYVVRRLVPNMANATGTDLSASLALFHDHSVSLGTTADDETPDEMSFNFLKGIPAYINTFDWSSSAAPGDELYRTPIQPMEWYAPYTKVGATHTLRTREYAPFAYVSQQFQQYRGSIRLMFKFAKTEYHSGRLIFAYYPITSVPTPGSITDSSFAIREIVDLRYQSEICLTLPYLLATKYQQMQSQIGYLVVTVLNELKAPDTASPNIQMLIYASAGPDYEVQVPSSTPATTFPIIPQMGDGPYDTETQRVSVNVGAYQTPPESLESSGECVGDCFTSVKQLMSRYTPTSRLVPVDTALGTLGVCPHAFNLPRFQTTDTFITVPFMGCDMIPMFSAGYAFFKGGVRIVQSNLSSDAQAAYVVNSPRILSYPPSCVDVTIQPFLALGDAVNSVDIPDSHVAAAYQTFDSNTGLQEYSVPYYSRTPVSLVDPILQHNSVVLRAWTPQSYTLAYYPGIQSRAIDPDNPTGPYLSVPVNQVQIMRSARDNFQLSYFLGFPHMFESLTPNA